MPFNTVRSGTGPTEIPLGGGGGGGPDVGIASAAASVAGSVISGLFKKSAAKKAYKRTRKLRRSAYQDTMGDMAKAGLNPILAYKQGATTASPVNMAQVPDYGEALSKGVQAGVATAKEKREAETATPLRKSQEQVFIQDLENKRAQGKLLELQWLQGLGEASNSIAVHEYLQTPAGKNAAIANFAPMTYPRIGARAYDEVIKWWEKLRSGEKTTSKDQLERRRRPFGEKPKSWDPFAPAELPTYQGPGWGRGY